MKYTKANLICNGKLLYVPENARDRKIWFFLTVEELIDVETKKRIPVRAHITLLNIWRPKYIETTKEWSYIYDEAKKLLRRLTDTHERFWTAYFSMLESSHSDNFWADVLSKDPDVSDSDNEECKLYLTLRRLCFI